MKLTLTEGRQAVSASPQRLGPISLSPASVPERQIGYQSREQNRGSGVHTNHSDAVRLVKWEATRVLQQSNTVRADLADKTPGRVLAYVFVDIGCFKERVRILERGASEQGGMR